MGDAAGGRRYARASVTNGARGQGEGRGAGRSLAHRGTRGRVVGGRLHPPDDVVGREMVTWLKTSCS